MIAAVDGSGSQIFPEFLSEPKQNLSLCLRDASALKSVIQLEYELIKNTECSDFSFHCARLTAMMGNKQRKIMKHLKQRFKSDYSFIKPRWSRDESSSFGLQLYEYEDSHADVNRNYTRE